MSARQQYLDRLEERYSVVVGTLDALHDAIRKGDKSVPASALNKVASLEAEARQYLKEIKAEAANPFGPRR